MEVTLFATTHCAFCKVEKQWLEKNNIDFEYIEIDNSQKHMDYLLASYGTSSVPLTEVKDENGFISTIRGFDRQALSKALNI